MTAYNAQAFLAEALESVLGQTLADYELLLVDDGSIDDTPRIIARYARWDARIVAVRLVRNCGVAHAKNVALTRARAPFVAVCDADDHQLPARLALQAEALRDAPARAMVGCRAQPFGDAAAGPQVWLPLDDRLARARILFQSLYGDAANMFRRTLVERHGLRYRSGAAWEDWLFQAEALRHGSVHVLLQTLLLYRRHAAQETNPQRRTASCRRTKATMLRVLRQAGVACSREELDLHHAISPDPFGRLTDPDFVRRHGKDLPERARAWMVRLARETARSGWTSPQAIAQVAGQVLQRLEENIGASLEEGQRPEAPPATGEGTAPIPGRHGA